MRQFLPIKGPGGRALTVKEKIALIVLAITLILCVLTLLSGDHAFGSRPAQNPVFALVSTLAGSVGVGIIALYAIVMLWSGLIFFKGEKVAEGKPLPGRAMAAVALVIGVSGILGLSGIEAAGDLGSLVGHAVANSLGSVFGFAVLLGMLALGANLAGQGAWSAFRGPAPAMAAPVAAPAMGGFTLPKKSPRVGGHDYLPDDGDPSADERTRAIAQAMEEIERSQGVTIVDVEPQSEPQSEIAERRPSIGEEVDEIEESDDPDTEEAQVRSGLEDVSSALARLQERLENARAHEEEEDEDLEEEEPEAAEVEDSAVSDEDELEDEDDDEILEDDQDLEEDDDELEEEEEDFEDEDEDLDEEDDEFEDEEPEDLDDEDDEEAEEDEDLEEEDEDLEDEEDEDDDELAEEEYEGEDDDEEWDDEAAVDEDDGEPVEDDDEDDAPTRVAQPYLFPVSRREIDEEDEEEEPVDEPEEAELDDDKDDEPAAAEASDEAGTRFDWRGRPID